MESYRQQAYSSLLGSSERSLHSDLVRPGPRFDVLATRYHFITSIELAARPHQIWETLAKSEDWVDWWRWLQEAEVLETGDPAGIGHRVRHQVSSPLRYRLTYEGEVTHAEEDVASRFRADGDLRGLGQFSLKAMSQTSTLITFHWLVETPKRWMNLLAPLARPLFVWNHHRLMEDFAKDLADALPADLLGVRNESVDRRDERFHRIPAV